jgi:RNA polymerase sigma-70 factor (ECF subfamily)
MADRSYAEEESVTDPAQSRRFEALALPHLDAAYNLARWLTGNDEDAQDVVQEAVLRALRYFGSFRGDNARPWLLQIVRHTCFAWMKRNRPAGVVPLDDEDQEGDAWHEPSADEPFMAIVRGDARAQVNQALAKLPVVFREVLVLREMEDLSYREIAAIAQVPVGTVMSRLARARSQMRAALASGRPALRAVTGTNGAKS